MSDPFRQSALLLHGLSAEDRQWILAQLAEGQRARLSGYLAELEQLGMPADRSLAEALLSGAAGRAENAAHRTGAHAAERATFGAALRAAPAEAVLAILAEQPAWLIALVLGIEPWPWREAIHVGVDASKRERIKQYLGSQPPAMLAQSLVAQLEARLAGNAAAAELPAQPGARATLGQRLKRLTRG